MTLDHDEIETKAEVFRDEDGMPSKAFVARVKKAVEAVDAEATNFLVGSLHEADLGALIELLDHDMRHKLIALMGDDFDFAALTEVGETTREDILEEIPVETLAEAVREMESDDAVAILETLEPEEQAEVLDALPAHESVVLRRSLNYPEDSAGRLMQTTLIAVPTFWSAGQVLDFFRDTDPDVLPDNFFEVFVVDPAYRFLGTVFLDALVRARPDKRVDEIMQANRRCLHDTDDRDEAARMFERYNLVSAPVVDEMERLVGVITIDDIVDVMQEAASEEIKALGGVNPEEELSDDFWMTARSRFWWLLVNLATAFLASSVLRLFENQIEKMVALAVLAPIVASQGGNSATQTMTVAVRALATQELSSANAVRVILRELAAAAVNGAAFGLITGVVAGSWFGNVGLAPVLALAMLTNLVAGALGGVLVPLALDRWGVDPAVSSSAFVTTVTDVVGYGAFLSIATVWFGLA
jgi:magnesium transporter